MTTENLSFEQQVVEKTKEFIREDLEKLQKLSKYELIRIKLVEDYGKWMEKEVNEILNEKKENLWK